MSCNSHAIKRLIPAGLNNCSWDGRYFVFDEYDSFCKVMKIKQTFCLRSLRMIKLAAKGEAAAWVKIKEEKFAPLCVTRNIEDVTEDYQIFFRGKSEVRE